jgi:pimeloyl-ACP methyl ester carboxylesterase
VSTGQQTQPRILTHRVDGPEDAPAVLLLNGGMMSISAWDEAAAVLMPRYRVVRCDFRGQLLTPELPPPDLAAHLADVVALLDHLGLETVHVVGTSFGGEVGLLLAARHGDRVASMVAATVVDYPPPDMQAIGERLVELCEIAMATGDGRPFLGAMNEIVYSPPFRIRVAADLAARTAAVASLPATWFAGGARLLQAVDRMDLRAELGRIACPTLVITAERDELMPGERSAAVAAAIPSAEHVVVAGSGHALVVEERRRFLDLVTEFLGRQSERMHDVLRSP